MKKLEQLRDIFQFIAVASEQVAHSWDLMDMFAELRGTDTRLAWENEVNRYQVELRMLYAEWVDDLAVSLSDYDYLSDEIILSSLAVLDARLVALSRQRIFEVFDLGYGAGEIEYTVDVISEVSSAMIDNERYIHTSLIPDLRTVIYDAIHNPAFLLLGTAFLVGELFKKASRVESYAGAAWNAVNKGAGMFASRQALPVYWLRDFLVEHCESCLAYGEREYVSYEALLAETGGVTPANGTACYGNCRCSLMVLRDGEYVRP